MNEMNLSPGARGACASCVFYAQPPIDPTNIGGQRGPGICRRFPPTVFPAPMQGQMGVLPLYTPVQPDNWCGEHMSAQDYVDEMEDADA